MTRFAKILALPTLALALAGCTSPSQFETAPVVLETPQGPVTCQLYTKADVSWDRAIDRPETMNVQQADALCRNEGIRRQKT